MSRYGNSGWDAATASCRAAFEAAARTHREALLPQSHSVALGGTTRKLQRHTSLVVLFTIHERCTNRDVHVSGSGHGGKAPVPEQIAFNLIARGVV